MSNANMSNANMSNNKMPNTNIYVLRLEDGRYYIGKSDNVMNRYQEHLNGRGSAWTRKYKPVSLEKTIENVSSFEEDKITKEYMSKYGIDKVRGGSYVEIQLSKFHTNVIKREIWAAKDLCTRCGRSGHFIANCYAKTEEEDEVEDEEEDEGDEDEGDEDEDEWGCEYCDRAFTTLFGCRVHERSCKEKNTKSKSYVCYRCGRLGHYSTDCYAMTNNKGYRF